MSGSPELPAASTTAFLQDRVPNATVTVTGGAELSPSATECDSSTAVMEVSSSALPTRVQVGSLADAIRVTLPANLDGSTQVMSVFAASPQATVTLGQDRLNTRTGLQHSFILASPNTTIPVTVVAANGDRRSLNVVFVPLAPAVTALLPAAGASVGTDCKTSGTSLQNCPTNPSFPSIITVVGSNFSHSSSEITVTIGLGVCVNPQRLDDNRLICTLPAQVGIGLALLVTQDGTATSSPGPTVSYAAPRLLQIGSTACTSDAGGLALTDCPRRGNIVITIAGEHFGSGVPSVLIGGAECTSVVHVANGDLGHLEAVTCALSEGTQLLRAVLLFQQGGQRNDQTTLTVSYAQCQPGTKVSPKNELEWYTFACPSRACACAQRSLPT